MLSVWVGRVVSVTWSNAFSLGWEGSGGRLAMLSVSVGRVVRVTWLNAFSLGQKGSN